MLNTTSSQSDNPFISFVDNITNSIESEINDGLNSFAKDLGLHDFYSAHILDFCEGFYTPTDMPNATFSKSDIHRNVTSCSNRTAMYSFNPRQTLQLELNQTGHGNINLTDLEWPSQVDDGLHALKVASQATFVLYCIAIGFMALAMLTALLSFFFEGRLSSFINVVVDWLAFVAMGIASAIVTAIIVKAADLINKYGNDIGISAQKGGRFLIITWVATGLMFIASIVWCFDCIVGRRSSKPHRGYTSKGEY